MPKFFCKKPENDTFTLTGDDAHHILKSLRMRVGEQVSLCDGEGTDYGCIITETTKDSVSLKVAFTTPSESESDVKVSIYQAVPKGDKASEVVRKCTELGAFSFHQVQAERSIPKYDEKQNGKKLARLKKIAAEAAMQSRRGIIPEVFAPVSFKKAISEIGDDKIILFYENSDKPLKPVLESYKRDGVKSIAVFIGPEGGFEESEVALAKENGAEILSLGKRILRTETAPVAALANIIYEMEN